MQNYRKIIVRLVKWTPLIRCCFFKGRRFLAVVLLLSLKMQNYELCKAKIELATLKGEHTICFQRIRAFFERMRKVSGQICF